MLTQCRSPGACLCVKHLHFDTGDKTAQLQNAIARGYYRFCDVVPSRGFPRLRVGLTKRIESPRSKYMFRALALSGLPKPNGTYFLFL